VVLLTCVLVDDITLMMLCSELTRVLTMSCTEGTTDNTPVMMKYSNRTVT